MINRWQIQRLKHLLSVRRGVNLTGARQVGKSTLAKSLELPSSRIWTLDDDFALEAAQSDPPSFVKHRPDETLIIDEIQKAPSLLNAIKIVLDNDNSKGQYLLTGSANLQFAKTVKDSLAGRLGVVRLRPFSLGEINGTKPSFLDCAFREDFNNAYAPMDKRDIIHEAFLGGYPEPRELGENDRLDWFKRYLIDLLTKDIRDITEIRKVNVLNGIAEWMFAHTSQFFSINELASKTSVSKETVQNYIEAIRAMYLFDELPAWNKSDYDKLGKRSKYVAADSSMVANILGWSEENVYLEEAKNGKLIETWVYNQLSAIVDLGNEYAISHYRDNKKREIDFLVERHDGAILGIEVKSGTVNKGDFKHLKWFAENLAKKDFIGIVLYSGEHTLCFGEGFYAVPLSALGA
jgi:predicted AAA+ superfamily ATPase